MRIPWIFAVVAAAAFVASACGGGGSNASTTPTSPSPTVSTITVDIVGSSGPASYNPNPAKTAADALLVWRNNTDVAHHIVMDDGSADFGNILPGALSAPKAVPGGAGNYHCVNHPTMVGSINGDAAPEPPADGGGVDY